MATEIETTGVIAKTSKNHCVVSVAIDNTQKMFSFSKTIFYIFGLKCEGDMTNLLEIGTEVDVCYRTRPGSSPTIQAVWLGDRPDIQDQATKRIYEQKGVVGSVRLHDCVIDTEDGKVLVNKGVLFRDGQRSTTITTEEEITIDAILFEEAHVSGALYEATCAWIGSIPRLVDRFNLEVDETKVELGGDVSGTIGVIPSEVVAFADVEVDCALIKVMVFRNSFQPACDRIQDLVEVGDRLCMRLRYGHMFAGRKQWFARVAVKASDVVNGMLEMRDTEPVVEPWDIEPDPIVKASAILTEKSCDIETGNISSKIAGRVKAVDFDKKCKILYSDPPLTGVISVLPSTNFGCITYGNLKILVDRSNFYVSKEERSGKKCFTRSFFKSYIALGDKTVNFEAVLMNQDKEKYPEITHEATCAWVGKKPPQGAMAASLPPSNFDLLEESDQVFYGIVSKLCLPFVALVIIPGLPTTVSVHVNSFINKPYYHTKGDRVRHLIGSYVKLDDCVEFKVKQILQCPQFLCAYDVELVHTKEIVESVRKGQISRKLRTGKQRPPKIPPQNADVDKPTSDYSEGSNPRPPVCVASSFKNGCLSRGRAFLISCSGTIKIGSSAKKKFITIEHLFGSSKVNDQTLYIHAGKTVDVHGVIDLHGRAVRFDAETTMASGSNTNFVIKRMWGTTDKRPPSEILLFSELKLIKGISTRCCPAKITSVPLHDAAIASVNSLPILVPFDALATLQDVNRGLSSIDSFLNVGDDVGLKFEKKKYSESGSYFRAVSCWALSKGGEIITPDDEIRPCTPRVNSWFNKWGHGAYFCKGSVIKSAGRYFVDYYSKSLGLTRRLDIFEKGSVSVNGKVVEFDKCTLSEGEKITFHVAHDFLDEVCYKPCEIAPKLFVACSWVGEEPSPTLLLGDILAVPQGCICSNWCYEVVVDSFPLPTHAICFLGYVPVWVPLPQITANKRFVGVEDVNLKKGDRVIVRIIEETVGDSTVLVSNDSTFKKVSECDYCDVLKNLSGRIEKVPNPTGLIKACSSSGCMVSFELCNVRAFNKTPNGSKKWFQSLKNTIKTGTKVYFSAIKVNAKTAPYRAYEVYVK